MPLRLVIGLITAFVIVGCNNSSSSPRPNPNGNGVVGNGVNGPVGTPPAPVVVTRDGTMVPATPAVDYNGAELNPETALVEYGAWQTDGDQKFFVPKNLPEGWQPYQNGYWSYDQELVEGQERGWSFVSADPWGWVTEHYGIWRHHERHGWVWIAFPNLQYQPSVVTWFNQGVYVGWYPYCEKFRSMYVAGHHFNDGFWYGDYHRIASIGFGIVLVNRADVTRENIAHHLITDRKILMSAVRGAQNFGPHPGGDRAKSLDFIQRYAAVKAPVGRGQMVTAKGGAKIVQPFMAAGNHPERQAKVEHREQQRVEQQQRRGEAPTGNNPAGSPRSRNSAAPQAPSVPAASSAVPVPRPDPRRVERANPQVERHSEVRTESHNDSQSVSRSEARTETRTEKAGTPVVVTGNGEQHTRVSVRTDDKGQQRVEIQRGEGNNGEQKPFEFKRARQN